MARPENYDPEVLAPGLEGFDFSRFFLTALPISGGVFAAQLFHEAGHKIYASLHDIYTSPPFLIPNSQLGIFGAITQLREPVRDRRALWDFSFAGVALGGGVSLALLIYGLVAGQVMHQDAQILNLLRSINLIYRINGDINLMLWDNLRCAQYLEPMCCQNFAFILHRYWCLFQRYHVEVIE